METNIAENNTVGTASLITLPELLVHWQGHRGLTRRVLEAFPDDQLYTFSIGGMRTYAALTMEMAAIAAMGVRGVAYGEWNSTEPNVDFSVAAPASKAELLELWDQITELIDKTWGDVRLERFHEHDVAYGMYPGKVYMTMMYMIDNEIHHRGQGYVYLRALGIEPPAFWDRPSVSE